MSDFGQLGSCENIWECPDIYALPLNGNYDNKKWVLMTSVGPNKGQYFIGSFNGKSFELDENCRDYLLDGKGLKGEVFADFDAMDYGEWEKKVRHSGCRHREITLLLILALVWLRHTVEVTE